MKKALPTFPQEILSDLISYLKRLERKGIRSLYLDEFDEASRGPKPASTKERAPLSVSAVREKLDALEAKVRICQDCPLHKTRTNAVFGAGNPATKVVFIGEAPGRDEDRRGEPFVGRAGQLLTKIFEAIGLVREDVFITNVLKCRPPDNRDPQESEVRCCEKYLISQIELIKPQVICALGRIAAQWLLQTKASLSVLRAGEYYYRGIRVLVTYHPAALLRSPEMKRPAWEDFKRLKEMLEKAP